MLNYLYAHWSKMSLVIAFYVTTLLVSSLPDMNWLIFLVWLQFPIYLVHEFEEHAWPGGFKAFFNQKVFHSTAPDMPLNDTIIFWVNILAIWSLFPIIAILAQHVDLSWGLVAIYFSLFDATLHIVMFLRLRRYNPGLIASVALNYPMGIYALIVANHYGVLTLSMSMISIAIAFVLHLGIVIYSIRRYRQFKLRSHGTI